MKLPQKPSELFSELSAADAADYEEKKKFRPALQRQRRVKDAAPAKLIAYDFETTRIAEGTPRPLYITAYGENPGMHYESEIDHMAHLQLILINNFLIPEYAGVKFVAWNGNNFDAYFVAAALVTHPDYIIRPYLTKSGSLRGLRVLRREDQDNKKAPSWEFLDGIAMLGLVGTPLKKFLDNFAPSFKKLEGPDFENEEFDARNPAHREYAMRDSVGLFHGMTAAQNILLERFNQPLTVTMGGACIKIFKAHMPEGVRVESLQQNVLEIVRRYVMRGGYCHCVKPYRGPVWKYDINQAYAAAMRDAKLPAGKALHTEKGLHKYATVYIARITATHANNIIPFYYRAEIDGKLQSVFSNRVIHETWITSIEHQQLLSEGWRVTVHESYTWEDHFSMVDYVNKLESIRTTCEGGPSGPIGTMVKAVGNHSYGKTVESLEPIEFIFASEAPPGFEPYFADGFSQVQNVYFRWTDDQREKDYHQPHIGAFITAHVRMVLRRAALLAPREWLYADTDCVVFSIDVTAGLDVDGKRYGAWKLEESGSTYQLIAKKVYRQIDATDGKPKSSSKGLHARKLTTHDFEQWARGIIPTQKQVQRNSFVKVMQGAEMYREQLRRGTDPKLAQKVRD